MSEFRMPSLGADMEAGTLVEWKVQPGERVTRGQVVAVVETQKGAIDIEIWEAGVVQRCLVAPGEKVPVGATLALLQADAEAGAAPALAEEATPTTVVPQPAVVPPAEQATASLRRRISPAARQHAAALGIDLDRVEPSAPGAVITREDVERAAAQAHPAPRVAAAPDWHARMRQAIAAAMSRSKREIPHYYLASDIDITRALEWLATGNASRPVERRVLPAVLFMKALALALREVPELNGHWSESGFRPASAVHLGMAIAMRGGGLVAPAIHDAHAKSIEELMAALRDLVERVRSGRLRSSELADPTVTLTSLGDMGAERVFGVIYPPQVALVGFGRVAWRPAVVDGAVVPRQQVGVTLAADHRASDGNTGARLLLRLDRLLQDPATWGVTT